MKKLSKYLNYMIVSILLSFGIFYLYSEYKLPFQLNTGSIVQKTKPVDVDQIVNKFMKQTAEQTLHEQFVSRMALKKQLTKSLNIKKPESEKRPQDISAEGPKLGAEDQDQNATPAEVIRNNVYQKELQKKLEEQEKQEYARQYIENARQQGYHLVLSPDLKVISVTPIRKPSQDEDSDESFPSD